MSNSEDVLETVGKMKDVFQSLLYEEAERLAERSKSELKPEHIARAAGMIMGGHLGK